MKVFAWFGCALNFHGWTICFLPEQVYLHPDQADGLVELSGPQCLHLSSGEVGTKHFLMSLSALAFCGLIMDQTNKRSRVVKAQVYPRVQKAGDCAERWVLKGEYG